MNNKQLLREQFESELLREDVVDYFLAKSTDEIRNLYGDQVSRMIGFDQNNSHHCYDLWEHTLRTVEAINITGLNDEDIRKVKIAAFFHDIAKPDVVGYNPRTKQNNFFNHAFYSAEIAREILEKMGYTEEEITSICFYIAHHDDFISYRVELMPYQKFHTFLREVDVSTVMEVIVQNRYDFEKMGYFSYYPTSTDNEEINKKNNELNNENKTKVKYICATLSNNGVAPIFKDYKGNVVNIDINLNEVLDKISSFEYKAKYVPSLNDYKLLIELCKADAKAQSEYVLQDGKVVDSRKRKLDTFKRIEDVLVEAYEKVSKNTK